VRGLCHFIAGRAEGGDHERRAVALRPYFGTAWHLRGLSRHGRQPWPTPCRNRSASSLRSPSNGSSTTGSFAPRTAPGIFRASVCGVGIRRYSGSLTVQSLQVRWRARSRRSRTLTVLDRGCSRHPGGECTSQKTRAGFPFPRAAPVTANMARQSVGEERKPE
jgi:hypothetical protein